MLFDYVWITNNEIQNLVDINRNENLIIEIKHCLSQQLYTYLRVLRHSGKPADSYFQATFVKAAASRKPRTYLVVVTTVSLSFSLSLGKSSKYLPWEASSTFCQGTPLQIELCHRHTVGESYGASIPRIPWTHCNRRISLLVLSILSTQHSCGSTFLFFSFASTLKLRACIWNVSSARKTISREGFRIRGENENIGSLLRGG